MEQIKPLFHCKNYATYCSEILNLKKMKFINGSIANSGYKQIAIRHKGCKNTYYYHRFIFECYYGTIPKGLLIDHINNNKLDNNIEKLQINTPSENSKKNYKPRSNVAIAVRAVFVYILD